MAFSGCIVSCHFASGFGYGDSPMPILGAPVWSEAPSTGATSTNAAPNGGPNVLSGDGQPVFRIHVSADSYVAIGTAPDETASPRMLILATACPYDVFANPGDKFSWVAA